METLSSAYDTDAGRRALKERLASLLAEKETGSIEFKHGKGGFPVKGFLESYSAFANTSGGTIVIGIKEKNGEFWPEGLTTERILQYEKILWDTLNDPAQISRKLITEEDIRTGEYDGSHFMMVSVPRASREERPVYMGQNPMRGSYRRDASGDYVCKEWEVSLMLSEQKPRLAMDAGILPGYTLEDLDKESLRGFRQIFMTAKPSHAWVEDDDLSLLRHMKAYGKDRQTGVEGLTLAGLLMFGTYDAITDALPHFMIDYREYTYGSERWSDRVYNDGTWESNLYQAYRKLLPRIQAFLPVPFRLKGNDRQDETKAHKALREAFVNAMVHTSYQSDARLTILKYPDRLVFSNPGTMLISKEQYYAGGDSICRNPALQTMFSLIGAVEKAGSGADTIIQGWDETGYARPFLTERFHPNKVELLFPIGESKDMPKANIATKGESSDSPKGNIASKGESNDSPKDNIASKGESNIASNISPDTYIASKEEGNIARERVQDVSDGNGKRKSYKVLAKIIVEYCVNWKSRKEIAMAMNYNPDYLRNFILPRMVKDGFLEMKGERGIRRPNQQYRATPKAKDLLADDQRSEWK